MSGFEPFGGEAVNPTQLLAEAAASGDFAKSSSAVVDGVVLPVVYGKSFEVLIDKIRSFDPDIVLALGQAGGRDAIEFERIAINLSDSAQPDNSSRVLRGETIEVGAENALFSTLPIGDLVAALTAGGVSARISNTAGLFVCNDLFFRLQSALSRSLVKSGFIHVPYLPDQAAAKPGAPSMEIETMKKGLRLMIEFLAK